MRVKVCTAHTQRSACRSEQQPTAPRPLTETPQQQHAQPPAAWSAVPYGTPLPALATTQHHGSSFGLAAQLSMQQGMLSGPQQMAYARVPLQQLQTGRVCVSQGGASAEARPAHISQQQPAGQENTAKAEGAAKSRLPGFVHFLKPQQLRVGQLDVSNIEWQHVKDGKAACLAARIPSSRLSDFQRGEEARGETSVLLDAVKKATDSVPVNLRGLCRYGTLKKAHQVERAQALPSAAPQALVPGTAPRRAALQKGTSIKLGCTYTFYAKVYSKLPDEIVLKFPCAAGDTAATCRSMQHCTAAGCPAHEGDERHALKYTEETNAFVVDRLKAHVQPKVIRSGACRGCACLPCAPST